MNLHEMDEVTLLLNLGAITALALAATILVAIVLHSCS